MEALRRVKRNVPRSHNRWITDILSLPAQRFLEVRNISAFSATQQIKLRKEAHYAVHSYSAHNEASSCVSRSFSFWSSMILCLFCSRRSSSHCSSGPLIADIWLHRFLVNTEQHTDTNYISTHVYKTQIMIYFYVSLINNISKLYTDLINKW